MDSYNFHFERMSNVDLHPLSLPVSRLSPAKSNSSIVDQLTHHQHGKGDSAYSSFSGGSTAPDYPSPFLPDDLQPSSFNHYADLKYVKAIYHPSQVLQSNSKTMDQLYRSMEVISQQYRQTNNADHNSHNGNAGHTNNNTFCNQEATLVAPSQNPYAALRPPPPPARLDSFIATRNLENSWAHHHGTDSQPQQPQQQQQPRSHSQPNPQSQPLNAPRPQMAKPDSGSSGLRTDPVYGSWLGSQQQQQQPQQSPTYHPHLQPHDQTKEPLNPEHLFITDNKAACEQQKSTNILSRSPPRGMSQTEHPKSRQPANSCGHSGDHYTNNRVSGNHFEGQRKRAHSAHNCLGPEPIRAASTWNVGQNFINSSIQHKGQFYFVTGVCKRSETGVRTQSASPCVSEAESESSTVVETHLPREKERGKARCHSTMDNLFRPLQERPHTYSDIIPNDTQCQDPVSGCQDVENQRPSSILTQSSRSFDALEQLHMTQNREIGRHTANNPIFYCGPEKNCHQSSTPQAEEVISLISNEQPNNHKREDQVKRGRRQPLGDVPSERINKETTPLLYHLTGASRVALKPKKDDFSMKGKEAILNKTGYVAVTVNGNERSPQGEMDKEDRGEVISHVCNTIDDSFKKYYKERLKDAQSKVLRETSFKRRDLQLSWPHRVRQKPELRPMVIHAFSSSQDSETSTDTLTASVTSEETERESVKEEVRDKDREKESEKVNGRPVNVAQPQVARIGGRRRLTPEQKKMCYSEPEKLNQLGGTPNHSSCRSLGNDTENFFAEQYEGKEPMQEGEQGLVAARRKMFETRGRALSASSLSKTNLKHLQHKALVEYMERKTGQKVAEPQQPGSQLPPPPRQRHSLGEKPFDWVPRPLSGCPENKSPKKKLHRPHSAGRILDSSTSSIRYAQFLSAHSGSVKSGDQSHQPNWRENKHPSQGKSASVESLVDQPEPPSFFRNRSTSTPHAFQAHGCEKDPSPVNTMETSCLQKNTNEDTLVRPAPEGQQRVRVVAQRGKSMEELGTSKHTRPLALSKSTEQLDQLSSRSARPGGMLGLDREKRSMSLFRESLGGKAQGQEGERGKQLWSEAERARQGQENIDQNNAQGQTQNQTQNNLLLKQDSTPLHSSEEDAGPLTTAGTKNLSRSSSPVSTSVSRARVHSGSPGSQRAATDELRLSRPCSEASNPPSPRSQETSERRVKSTSAKPNQTKLSHENRTSTRVRTSPSVTASEREQSVDEPSIVTTPCDSNQEVSLSCGVTTDPSLWILPPEEGIKEDIQNTPLTDDVFADESTSSAPPAPKSEISVSPSTSVSDADTCQHVEGEKDPETEEERAGESQGIEERGTPEGEMESPEKPAEKPQWEELVEAVVKADQSLTRVLYPLANRKTALMLMEQLLSEDTLLMEEHYKKKQEQRGGVESAEMVEDAEPCTCPAPDSQKPQSPELQSKADITEKKHLLVSCIEERLRALEETRAALQVEIRENMARGEVLEVLVREHCLPVELERYNLFIGDLERVVSLLLCLSARLARVQNALSTVDQHTDAEEKQSLDNRHRLLCKQREDAKDLKDNLDRRESLVSTFLSRQLSAEQLQDYRRFVQTKASLLIRQKDLEEKQRLGEEQLEALHGSPNL
ncbi:protein Shroom3 isoform X2 [Myripristis murdjan]|uniref:protein Shroom3 isoform X2 n=1 Tax=Myripristis murdjan TaxID=586833 RepID=UPI001175EAD2|nr:protein Shroom3-like isoform X2 [Myripristis murdjan]